MALFWNPAANANWASLVAWAATDGGAPVLPAPTATDDANLTATSGFNCNIAASATCKSLSCAGFTHTLSGASALAISGSLTLGAGMTRTFSGAITFNSTASQTITSNGIALDSGVTFSGVGGTWQLQDAFVTGAGHGIVYSNGTIDCNAKSVTAGTMRSTGSATRVLTIAGSTIHLNGSSGGNLWDTNTTAGMALNASGSLIKFEGTTVNDATMLFGTGLTFEDVEFAGSNTGKLTFSSSNGVYLGRHITVSKLNSTMFFPRKYKLTGALKTPTGNVNVVFNGVNNKRYKTTTWASFR